MAVMLAASTSWLNFHSQLVGFQPGHRRPLSTLLKNRGESIGDPAARRCSGRIGFWRRLSACRVSAASSGSPGAPTALFPAGKKQAKVQIPALFVSVSADEVAASEGVLEALAAAVAGGATAVVLSESAAGGATELYEAALRLKELLRGRAALLIADRTDIAPAADADGALLSPQGLPTVVAKRNLGDGLLLVGRLVESAAAAVQAAKEGANYVVLQGPNGLPSVEEALAAKQQQLSSGSIPVVVSAGSQASPKAVRALVGAGLDGLAVPLSSLCSLASALSGRKSAQGDPAGAADAVMQALAAKSSSGSSSRRQAGAAEGQAMERRGAAAAPLQLSQLLSTSREEMVAQEKAFLEEVLDFLQENCRQLEEVSLLVDALMQLDELFLVVVVGEFNSGKSAVINALLGQRYLAEGILPTTNEINILKWADPERGGERVEQGEDGMYTRYLPAELLKELNVVDTPGTNVILERQQRLTEEYVPRADLVLFVLSADRPFTESEVRFLKYVRRWGKKVVFVVNKVDILSSGDEVSEVVDFVRQNAVRLLGVEGPRVLPVSSRAAMEAKAAAAAAAAAAGDGSSGGGGGTLSPHQLAQLVADPRWQRSRFESLERFIYDFLVGGGGAGQAAAAAGAGSNGSSSAGGGVAESVRLKLQTPLAITQALLEAAGVQLQQELAVAREEEQSVRLVRSQLQQFKAAMVRDAAQQRQEVARLVGVTTKKAAEIVDQTLQLSNLDVLVSYLFGKSEPGKLLPVAARFNAEVAGDGAGSLRNVVREHSTWLAANCDRQVSNYRAFAEARAAALGQPLVEIVAAEHLPGLESDAEGRRRWRQMRQLATEVESSSAEGTSLVGPDASVAAVAAFDPKKTEVLLEEEVREAVLGTAGTAAGAGAFGVLLTSVLPTTLEDLLALGISGMVGYVSILNLPLRRAEAKRKLETLATKYCEDVQCRMEEELTHALDRCEAQVMGFVEPLEQLMAEQVARAEAAEAGRAALEARLDALQLRVANLE